jgi:hypothetical protein
VPSLSPALAAYIHSAPSHAAPPTAPPFQATPITARELLVPWSRVRTALMSRILSASVLQLALIPKGQTFEL